MGIMIMEEVFPLFFRETELPGPYLNEKALEPHFSRQEDGDMRFIGLDETLKENIQIQFVEKVLNIDESLRFFPE